MTDNEDEVFVPIIIPVVFMTLAMFLIVNGPYNWSQFWFELFNTPPDARHAQRGGSRANFYAPFNSGSRRLYPLKMQYLEYAKAVEYSLSNQLNDPKSREALVTSFFSSIPLNSTHIKTMTKMIEKFSLSTLDKHRKLMLSYAKQFQNKNVRRPFVAKINEFVDHFEVVRAGRENLN